MPEHGFVFHDGTVADTPQDLLRAIQRLGLDLTARHIREDGNDYASWLRSVHHDERLARAVEKCRSPSQVENVLKGMLKVQDQARTPLTVPALGPHGKAPHKTESPPQHTQTPPKPAFVGKPSGHHTLPFIAGLAVGILIGVAVILII